MPHILVLAVGRDRLLLETRSRVLQAAGYTVIPELSLKKAVSRSRDEDFDVVLLCHSISADDRERLVRLIREHTSRKPIVSIATTLGQRDLFADATIESDPDELLNGLHDVLRKKPREEDTLSPLDRNQRA